MNWWLLGLLARALEASERQAVLGDIAESDEGIFPAVRDLLGLVIRRQAALWMAWQPWLALLGISIVAGASLRRIAYGFNLGVFEQLHTYRKYGVHYSTGLTPHQDFAFLACLGAGLILWSWTSGFVLGSLSGRTAWITGLVFCFVIPGPPWLLIPPLAGAFMGARQRVLSIRGVSILAAGGIVLAILATWMSGRYETAQLTWSGGAWGGGSQVATLPFLLVSWPALYLLINAARKQTNEVPTK